MNFANPHMLWALPAVVLLTALWWIYGDVKRKKVLKEFAGGDDIVLSGGKRFFRRVLLLAGLLMLVLAAARPCWGEKPLEFNISERDALIVFDVSKSMLAGDVAPSRLEHGKWLLRELIKQNPDVSFGLSAFSGRAFISCPVTNDRVSLEQCIDELQCDLVPVGGTNLAAALNSAIQALKAAGGTVRDIILITDGEELTGSIDKELKTVKASGIRLLVVGLGDPAIPALIPEIDEQGKKHFKRDRAGDLVKTKLNETLLRKIAAATGGIYVNSNPLNTGLKELSGALSSQQTNERKAIRRSLPIERFMIFLVLGAAALAVYMFMDEVPRHRNPVLRGLLACMIFMSAFHSPAADEKTVPIPEKTAAPDIAAEKTDFYRVYNNARELQLQNKSPEAAQIYEGLLADKNTPDEIKTAAMHNMGVAEQTNGRIKFSEAAQQLRKSDLDGALEKLKVSEKHLAQSEEFYSNVLKTGRLTDITSQSQQKQLADRHEVDELRKKIEQLKQKQKQAREQTKNAEKQNQQNQQKQQNKSDQQNQQNQQKQQNKSDQQNQKQRDQSAQQALNNAKNAVNDYKKAAEDMKQQQLADQASQAADRLKDAEKKQQQGDFDGAAKDIEKASEALGRESGQDQNNDKGKSAERKTGDSGKNDKKTQSAQAAADQSGNKMDDKQTDALLDSMSQDEKLLRDAIKSNRNRRVAPVEKDW